MEIDAAAALGALESALTGLLTGVTFERFLIASERVGPVGIGGFVRYSSDPHAEIVGVRVSGLVRVAVRGATREALDEASKRVIGALVGASRADLAAAGIQRLALSDLGSPVAIDADTLEREIPFRIQFEHQKVPTAGEGVIETIPIELSTTAEPQDP